MAGHATRFPGVAGVKGDAEGSSQGHGLGAQLGAQATVTRPGITDIPHLASTAGSLPDSPALPDAGERGPRGGQHERVPTVITATGGKTWRSSSSRPGHDDIDT